MLLDAGKGGEMDSSRDNVIGGLAEVHMVIRMDLAGAKRATNEFASAIGNDLVGIHIGRSARTGLKNIQDKMAIKFAIDDFLSGLYNGFSDWWLYGVQFLVHLGGGLFNLAE